MVDSICAMCGEKLEQAWHGELCYGCHLDSLIPSDYPQREEYTYDTDYGHQNATRHPPIGVPILDDTPLRIHQIATLVNPRRINMRQ